MTNSKANWSAGLTTQIMEQTTHWADEFLLQEGGPRAPAAAPPPAPAQSAHTVPQQLSPNTEVWRLTHCKRFGDPLLSFVKNLLPNVAGDLAVMPSHSGTDFRTVYYSSECTEWFSMQGLFLHLGIGNVSIPDEQQRQHFLKQVVWNHGLFSALITCILRQLVMEARLRRDAGTVDPVFVHGEMLVFVGFALNRLKVPFQFLINEALSWEPLLQEIGLDRSGLTTDMVSVRLANDSTGPTFAYGHVVRHPRYRDLSQTVWQPNDLQMNGDQAKDQIQYIMLTRPVKDCTLWVHTEPLGWPGEQKVLTYEDCDEGQTHKRADATREIGNLDGQIRTHAA